MRNPCFPSLYRDPTYGPDLQAVHLQARRLGLPEADCEDCAVNFLLHKLVRCKTFEQDVALRYRCAHDFACDAYRTHVLRARHETSAADAMGQTITSVGWDWPDGRPTLEQEVVRQALWDVIQPFFDLLQPVPRQVFRSYYQDGATVSELAVTFGRTPHVISQMLSRSRQRILTLLVKAGIDAAELSSY